MGITEKPLPPEIIMTKEEISKLSKEKYDQLEENYIPRLTKNGSIKWSSKELEHKDWDTDDDEYEEAKEFPEKLWARPKEKKIPTVDLDAFLDNDVLEEYKCYKPSEMFDVFTADKSDPNKVDKDTLQATIDDVTKDIRSLNGSITGKSNSKKSNKQKEIK